MERIHHLPVDYRVNNNQSMILQLNIVLFEFRTLNTQLPCQLYTSMICYHPPNPCTICHYPSYAPSYILCI